MTDKYELTYDNRLLCRGENALGVSLQHKDTGSFLDSRHAKELIDSYNFLQEVKHFGKKLKFTGHAHTLKEDIDTLRDRIIQAELGGTSLMHPVHMMALLYNLNQAVKMCEKLGIKTFAKDYKDV